MPNYLSSRTWVAVVGLGILVIAGVAIARRSPPPQIGADTDVYQTVDALFTAVTSQDLQRVADCEKRLHQYRDAGKLPLAAAVSLDEVIGQARSGSWQAAAKSLYGLMQGQRREVVDAGRHR